MFISFVFTSEQKFIYGHTSIKLFINTLQRVHKQPDFNFIKEIGLSPQKKNQYFQELILNLKVTVRMMIVSNS